MKVYISGPMTGHVNLNKPAFYSMANTLQGEGHTVINPADVEGDSSWTWLDYMKADVAMLLHADAIMMLHGWKHSKGAFIERAIAKRYNMHVMYQ